MEIPGKGISGMAIASNYTMAIINRNTIRRRNTARDRQSPGRRMKQPERTRQSAPQKKNSFIPKPRPGEIRTLILGGVSEIGKNMYAVEYNDSIVVFECGTMFGESTTPGISTIMPNIEYLKERKQSVRALVVSDASMAHIGAIPHAIRDIGNPTVYCRTLTKAVIERYQETVRRAPTPSFYEVKKSETVKIADDILLHFFGISDETPGTLGIIMETESGCVAYTDGMRVKNTNGVVEPKEEERFKVLREKEVVLSIAGSVNAERPGFSMSDKEIAEKITHILKEAPNRTFLPLFPSQIQRNGLILEAALKLGKKIFVQSVFLLKNLETACDLGLISIPKEAIIPIDELQNESDGSNDLIVLGAAENEEYDMLEKMSQEAYSHTSVMKEDTMIFPSPVIPTNARSTQNLKDRLSRLGAIIQSYDTSDVKASIHAGKDELHWIHQRANPKYFIPVQGYHYMLTAHTHILRDIGMSPDSCVIPENGSIIDISQDNKIIKRQKQRLSVSPVSVDGHTPTLVHDVVVQDRKTLAQEGILIVVVFINQKKLELRKSPDILSRGFIYLRESRDLIARIRLVIKKVTEKEAQEHGKVDIDTMKKAIQKEAQNFLVNETNKKPIIIPVIFT